MKRSQLYEAGMMAAVIATIVSGNWRLLVLAVFWGVVSVLEFYKETRNECKWLFKRFNKQGGIDEEW